MNIGNLSLEKTPRKVSQIIFEFLANRLPIRDGKRRGEGFKNTGAYQIRIMPVDSKNTNNLLNETLSQIKSIKEQQLEIKNVKVNAKSLHSQKFSSIQFDVDNITYDVVIAAGANKGESFENEILFNLNNFIAGIDDNVEAKKALEAIQSVEPSITPDQIDIISKRQGKTRRANINDSDEIGKIIADLIIRMKNGNEHYISLKNLNGTNIAQFGIASIFDDNLNANTSNPLWNKWLAPFNLDSKKITAGLKSYQTKQKPSFTTEETINKKLTPNSAAYALLENMWGTGYIYLREKRNGWEAMKIDKEYLAQNLLKDLEIVKILYPSEERKSVEVYLKFTNGSYRVRLRNKNDPKCLKPTIIQLEKTK